jgi:hypothetical protein
MRRRSPNVLGGPARVVPIRLAPAQIAGLRSTPTPRA